jgi:hypothetical protein
MLTNGGNNISRTTNSSNICCLHLMTQVIASNALLASACALSAVAASERGNYQAQLSAPTALCAAETAVIETDYSADTEHDGVCTAVYCSYMLKLQKHTLSC